MKTRYGISPWVDNYPAARRPDHPRLRGEHTAEVVIIGGGMTGCATAYACALAGIQPMLIEAGRLGQGSTGRSAGLILPEPGPSFRDVVNANGLRTAKRVFDAWRRAALDGAALLRRLSIQCGLEQRDSMIVAHRDEEKDLRREYDARQAAGVDSTWLTSKQVKTLSNLDASAGVRLRDGFALDPYRACLGVATAAVKRGATVFERTRVKRVRFGRKGVEVHVEGGGIVRAATAIVATGIATEEFRSLRRHFKRREIYLALTEPMPAAVRKQVGNRTVLLRSWRSPVHRVCWTRDDRMLVAGGDQDETPVRKRDAVLVQRTGQLMYEALTMYPTISGLQPQYGWDASYGETADRLMYIGPHRNFPRHLFALGGSADSMTGSFLAARVLTRAVRGTPEKGDDVFGWTR